ncbi:MAG: hypothetical protein J6P93_02105 [Alphaproteobacteria bacterium]|nr:hypothetical protein [Alphaproteobacteria bacterium]
MKYYKIKKTIISCLIAFGVIFPSYAALQVEDLSGNTLDAIGLKKTLPFTSWGKIPFDKLKEMTLDLSRQKKSPALEKMLSEVLIQPTFIAPNVWTETQSVEWMETRLQALLNMSRSDLVLQLIDQLPTGFVTNRILKIKAEALLLQDNWQPACVIALQNASKDDDWGALQMFCLGLAGEKDKAQLAFDLWQEKHKKENMPSFVMGQLMDVSVKAPENKKDLTVAETYVLLQLKSAFLEDAAFPLPYQRLAERQFSGFGKAIDVKKLFEIWQKAGLDSEQQAYRFYLLVSYADLFLPDLRFIHKNGLWQNPSTKQNLLLQSVFLKDKPETQITGSDLLLGLWLLGQQTMDAGRVFLLLNKGGLDLEQFVLEQMNP